MPTGGSWPWPAEGERRLPRGCRGRAALLFLAASLLLAASLFLEGCSGKQAGREGKQPGAATREDRGSGETGRSRGGSARSSAATEGARVVRSYLETVVALSNLALRAERNPEEQRTEAEMNRLSARMASLLEDPRAEAWPHYGRRTLPPGLDFRVLEVLGPFYSMPDMEGYLARLKPNFRDETLRRVQEETGGGRAPSSLWLAFYLARRDGAWKISFAHPTEEEAAQYALAGPILSGATLSTRAVTAPPMPGASPPVPPWEPVGSSGRLRGSFRLAIDGLRLPLQGLLELEAVLRPEPGMEGYPEGSSVSMPFKTWTRPPEELGLGVRVEEATPQPGPMQAGDGKLARVTMSENLGDVRPGRYRFYLGLSFGGEGGGLYVPVFPSVVEAGGGAP